MTLKDCYTTLGGDYADVAARLHSDRLVQKFVLKYLEDPSYNQLCAAMGNRTMRRPSGPPTPSKASART